MNMEEAVMKRNVTLRKRENEFRSYSGAIRPALFIALLPCLLFVQLSCGSKSLDFPEENLTPTAVAIPSRTSVTVGSEIILDGSYSFDPEGEGLTYQWYECDYYVRNIDDDFTCVSNRESGLFRVEGEREGLEVGQYATGPTQSVWLPDVGYYTFILVVNDGDVDSYPDWVTVTAAQAPQPSQPVGVAVATPANAPPGTEIVLDGSRSVAIEEGLDIAEYRWEESSSNPQINLIQRVSGLTYAVGVTQSIWPTTPGTYSFTLIVVDTGGNSSAGPIDYNGRVQVVINQAPSADAGSDEIVRRGELVSLDGSGSSDPDDDDLSYSWSFSSLPDGSTATLSSETAEQPTFTADLPGNYVLTLVVSDGTYDSDPDSVTITCNNPPVPCAGSDLSVSIGELVILDGICSFDADFDTITYSWTLYSQPLTSTAVLNNASTRQPDITPDAAGDYAIFLVVNDGLEDSDYADWVTITATNLAPVAILKADPTSLTIGQTALVDGSSSYDPENYPLSLSWTILSQPGGSAPTLAFYATDATMTIVPDLAGDYVIRLVVNDGVLDSYPDWVTITATNLAPIAVAKSPLNGLVTWMSTTLDGSGSSDPDGTIVSYLWQQTAGPAVSVWSPNSVTSAVGPFTAEGIYTFQLTVTDNGTLQDTDTTTITVANAPPAAVAKSYPNNIHTGMNSVLDGSLSSDADGTITTYLWQRDNAGPAVSIWAPNSVTSAVGPFNSTGDFVFKLTVTDSGGAQYSDWTTVTVVDQPPAAVAKAMPNNLFAGESTMLDGSLSSDHEGALTYSWTQSSGDTVTLGSSTAVYSTAGTFPVTGWYEFVLTVTDTYAQTATDFVAVYASPVTSCPTCPTNEAPVAEAGPGQNAGFYDWVELDGSASTDADGDDITHYFWQQVSGIPVNLEVGEFPNPVSFIAPNEVSELTFSLVVSDGKSISYADVVTVSVWKAVFRSNTTGDPFIDARLDEPAGLFVSQRGQDIGYCGDPVTTPCNTISYAMHSRWPTNITADVYVGTWTQAGDPIWDTYYDATTGTYVENVVLYDSTIDRGVSIFGGFFDDGTGNWWRDLDNYPTATTIIANPSDTNWGTYTYRSAIACDRDLNNIQIENFTFIDGFEINSANDSELNFGIRCDSSMVTIRNNSLIGKNNSCNDEIMIFSGYINDFIITELNTTISRLERANSPTIVNNYIYAGNRTSNFAILLCYGGGSSFIANNIIFGGNGTTNHFGIYLCASNTPQAPVVINNIIYPCYSGTNCHGIYELSEVSDPNLYYNNITGTVAGTCLYYDYDSVTKCKSTIDDVNNSVIIDNGFPALHAGNNISVNPKFTNSNWGNPKGKQLTKESQCIDAGADTGIRNDKGLNRRPVDVKLADGTDVDNNPLDTNRNVFDIGPYEYPNPVSN